LVFHRIVWIDFFKVFTQVDSSTTRLHGGSGLGLFIAKQFIDLLGGIITVSSELGTGTTFKLAVPFKIAKDFAQISDRIPPTPESFSHISHTSKILVVDDNLVNQTVALKMLSFYGFINCDKATDGAEALEFMKEKRYDLVLMDCMMPIMDGYTATKEVRVYEQQNALPATPIVGLTANALKADESKCLLSGMNMYCRKPLTRKSLRGILEAFLPHRKEI